jgi:hypothetical protein
MYFRFGHCEKGMVLFLTGAIPLVILVIVNLLTKTPYWYTLLIVFGYFLSFMGLLWIIYNVRSKQANVIMDNTEPEEVKEIRITRDGIILFKFVPKGSYGRTKSILYGENADFNDVVSLPLRTTNGDPAVLVYDMCNNAIDLRRIVARKFMRKHVNDGLDAYKIAKDKGKVVPSE